MTELERTDEKVSKKGLANAIAALGPRRKRRMFVALRGDLVTVRVTSSKMRLSEKLFVSWRTVCRAYDTKDEDGVFYVKNKFGEVWGVRELEW